MKSSMRIERPDDVNVTLTVTMTLGQWLELRDQLQGGHPASQLSGAIVDMVMKVRRAFEPEKAAEG